MLICVGIPCNFRHNCSVRPPSVVICGFPHLCFDFSVVHDYVCSVSMKRKQTVSLCASNKSTSYNIIYSKTWHGFSNNIEKTYTLSCNSRIFHILYYKIFIHVKKTRVIYLPTVMKTDWIRLFTYNKMASPEQSDVNGDEWWRQIANLSPQASSSAVNWVRWPRWERRAGEIDFITGEPVSQSYVYPHTHITSDMCIHEQNGGSVARF